MTTVRAVSTESLPTVGVAPDRVELDVIPPEDWILLRLDPRQTASDGGILVPGQSVPPARTGVVIRMGPGRLSEDGKTRLPMPCVVGDRILFERAAGKGLPRVPRETIDGRGWAYLMLKAGSVNAIVGHESRTPGEQRALDAGAAGVPALPPGAKVSVSRVRLPLTAARIFPVQDWLAIRLDAPAEQVDPSPRPTHRAVRYKANGKPVLIKEKEPEERAETWSGTVLARGPGLLTVVRCLDGDRMTTADPLCKVGDRILGSWSPPWVQLVNDLKPVVGAGDELLIREYPCVCAILR